MNLESLKTVALVARHGSFAAAARVLDVDPSSVSRIVAIVEAELGLRLFQRSTRRLSTTEEGATYIALITPILEEMDRAQDIARDAVRAPSGTLRMTASVAFSHICILPQLDAFKARYPGITLELLPTDANLDLRANSIDLAIRLAPAPSGDLISSKLIPTHYIVCASREYLARGPRLDTPQDLCNHDCLRFAHPDFRTRWKFKGKTGDPFDVDISGGLIIGSALSLKEAAMNGLGPTLLADWLVGPEVQSGRLVNAFPDYSCTATEFDTAAWILYPTRSFLPQKVRVMIDFLRETLT